jgi:transposase
MDQLTLFTAALGLQSPWKVTDVRFSPEQREIHFEVGFEKGSHFACAQCGHEAAVHDTKERVWQHLNFFQYSAYIHAAIPRTGCKSCGSTRQVEVPWARPQSGFTQLMEALLVTLCAAMPVAQVGALLGIGDDRIWRVLEYYVPHAREQADFSKVTDVGVDETACRRGHHYISLFHDLLEGRLLFAVEGRKADVFESFVDDLEAHQGCGENIRNLCMDLSRAYRSGAEETLPWAQITFDEFHVIQLANKVVDAVRREEVRHEPLLKRQRYSFLKDSSKWSSVQRGMMEVLSKRRLKTYKAWQLREALREIFREAPDRDHAEAMLARWYSWARRCRVRQMKEFALTIHRHWDGILNYFDSRLTNGRVEGVNSLIQAAKARARGYKTTHNLILMSYLVAGKLAHLPANPYRVTSTSCARA